jgi:hypothetical protein
MRRRVVEDRISIGGTEEFIVEYLCTTLRETKTAFLPAEANGKTVSLAYEDRK